MPHITLPMHTLPLPGTLGPAYPGISLILTLPVQSVTASSVLLRLQVFVG